jgi:hypothetical protein
VFLKLILKQYNLSMCNSNNSYNCHIWVTVAMLELWSDGFYSLNMYFRNTMGIPTLKLKIPFGYAFTNYKIKKRKLCNWNVSTYRNKKCLVSNLTPNFAWNKIPYTAFAYNHTQYEACVLRLKEGRNLQLLH